MTLPLSRQRSLRRLRRPKVSVQPGSEKKPQISPLRCAPVEKTFPRRSINTEISPLRCASVEMTRGRAALPERVVAGPALFITLVGPQGHHFSGREICGFLFVSFLRDLFNPYLVLTMFRGCPISRSSFARCGAPSVRGKDKGLWRIAPTSR
jgi:hypothetical protein